MNTQQRPAKLLAPLLTSALLTVQVTAAAEARQSVGLTTLYTSEDAAHFGEYSDLEESGAHVTGFVDIGGEPGWSSGDAAYWSVFGRNHGLDTYEADLSLGEQGRYDLTLNLDGISQYKRGDARTPYQGDTVLSLPADWVAGPSAGYMAALNTSARRFDQESQRDRIRLAGAYRLNERWSIDLAFQHEEKDGTQVLGGAIFADASTAFAALLPAPIDQQTETVTSAIAYAGERLSSTLTLLHSAYRNNNERPAWDNAFAGVGGEAIDYPAGQGSLSLAPDHDRLQLRLSGAYLPGVDFLRGLTVQWDGAWDQVVQDELLQPYTINPALVVTTPLPRDRLDATLETLSSDLRFTYRPPWRVLRKLNLRGEYHYDERSYDRSRDAYQYVRGDGADQPQATLAIFANRYDNRREGFEFAGDYRLPWWRGKLSLEYGYEEVMRRNAAVEQNETDTYRAVLRIAPLQNLTARIDWSFADRRASTYQWDQSFFSRRTSTFINAVPADQRFDNHPALAQYYLANAETDAVKLTLGYTNNERWYVAADIQWQDIGYDQSELGLTDTESWFYSADIQYMPADKLAFFGFASYSSYDSDAAGRSFGGGVEQPANRIFAPLPQGSDPARNWFVATEDEVYTLSGGITWTYSDTLNFDAQFVYVATESDNTFASGGAPGLDASGLPVIETTLHTISLAANYQVHDDVLLTFHYQYYRYDETDWALDNVGPGTLDNVLGLGEAPDDEAVNVLGISVAYSF